MVIFLEMGGRTCDGCSTTVTKPVVCVACDIVSHPGCMHRIGHPHRDDQFLDCRNVARGSQGDHKELLEKFKAMIHVEFEIFRKEIREDLDRIRTDVVCLSKRVDDLELLFNSRQRESLTFNEEEVMAEIEDREEQKI